MRWELERKICPKNGAPKVDSITKFERVVLEGRTSEIQTQLTLLHLNQLIDHALELKDWKWVTELNTRRNKI